MSCLNDFDKVSFTASIFCSWLYPSEAPNLALLDAGSFTDTPACLAISDVVGLKGVVESKSPPNSSSGNTKSVYTSSALSAATSGKANL